MIKVVAPLAFRLGLNLNRVFFPKLARERGEPWTARALRAKACERDRDPLPQKCMKRHEFSVAPRQNGMHD